MKILIFLKMLPAWISVNTDVTPFNPSHWAATLSDHSYTSASGLVAVMNNHTECLCIVSLVEINTTKVAWNAPFYFLIILFWVSGLKIVAQEN